MTLKFCSISSGSSGNCYLVKTENTALLVDAGISCKKILEGVSRAGTEPQEIEAVLITHEHIDHIKSVKTLAKKIHGLKVCSNRATFDCFCDEAIAKCHLPFETGKSIQIGDITVDTFKISHDAADPVGFSFSAKGSRISLVTDTGIVTEEIYSSVKNSDLLVVEANHDVHTLQFCGYPYQTKRRIIGDKGHLSNEAAGQLIRDVILDKERQEKPLVVLLAHLSKENNFPEMALASVRNILEAQSLYIGKDLEIEVLQRDSLSKLYCL